MINNRLTLLLDDDLGAVAAAAVRLRQLLPDINVDRWGVADGGRGGGAAVGRRSSRSHWGQGREGKKERGWVARGLHV